LGALFSRWQPPRRGVRGDIDFLRRSAGEDQRRGRFLANWAAYTLVDVLKLNYDLVACNLVSFAENVHLKFGHAICNDDSTFDHSRIGWVARGRKGPNRTGTILVGDEPSVFGSKRYSWLLVESLGAAARVKAAAMRAEWYSAS
jgi:hypothetical protein